MSTDWIRSNDRELLDSIRRHEGTKDYIYTQIRANKIKVAEGCDAKDCMNAGLWPVYIDSKGLPTVGVGHLVTGKESYNPYAGITDTQAEHQLASDIEEHLNNAKEIANEKGMEPNIGGNYVVQRFMTEMCFNIGKSGYLEFKNGLRKLASAVNNDGEFTYNEAADEHLDSKWRRDVGNRAIEMCNTLRALDD